MVFLSPVNLPSPRLFCWSFYGVCLKNWWLFSPYILKWLTLLYQSGENSSYIQFNRNKLKPGLVWKPVHLGIDHLLNIHEYIACGQTNSALPFYTVHTHTVGITPTQTCILPGRIYKSQLRVLFPAWLHPTPSLFTKCWLRKSPYHVFLWQDTI